MKNRFAALSGIRFVGAIHVTLYHFGARWFQGLPMWMEHLRRAAAPQLSMFYCLSGFLLTFRYLEPMAEGKVGLKKFYLARVARIYPLYLSALAFDCARWAVPPPSPPAHAAQVVLVQFFGVQSWTPRLVWGGNLPSWSVSVELFFYLVFPLLAIPLRKISLRDSWLLLGGAWLVSLLVPALYIWKMPDPIGAPFNEMVWLNVAKFNPLSRLPEFVMGMAVGRIFLDDVGSGRRRDGALMTTLSAIVIVLVMLNEESVPYILLHNSCVSLAWAILVLGLAHGGLPARLLGWKPLELLGESSYAIYLWQLPLYLMILKVWGEPSLGLFYLLLVGVGLASYFGLERPAQRWILRVGQTVIN